jgi:hypothetical protein
MLAAALSAVLLPCASARAFDVILNAQGEFMDAYLVNGTAFPPKVVFVDPDPVNPDSLASPYPRVGRHLNGKLCFFPRGFGHNKQFVVADDTYREACIDRDPPQARCSVTHRGSRWFVGTDPDGWGIFKRTGRWKKRHIHAPWNYPTDPQPQGTIDPQGCAFDSQGRLWGNDVGSGDPLNMDPTQRGAVIVFFPGLRHRYDTYCFIDNNLAQAGMPAMDEAGNLYVAETGMGRMWKYSPPFPTSVADCPASNHLVTTPPTKTMFPTPGELTPVAIVRVPGTDHWYIDSVLLPGVPGQGGGLINEYDANGLLVRNIVPSNMLKNPIGMDVGSDGTLYYAELNLNPDTSTGCGRVSQVRFVGGTPQAPEVLGKNLSFPDGVTVVDSSQLRVNFAKLPPAPEPPASSCGGE